ncbi:MAG: hypothetical protein R2827_08825 [Bdellovibrionales bacterium]
MNYGQYQRALRLKVKNTVWVIPRTIIHKAKVKYVFEHPGSKKPGGAKKTKRKREEVKSMSDQFSSLSKIIEQVGKDRGIDKQLVIDAVIQGMRRWLESA